MNMRAALMRAAVFAFAGFISGGGAGLASRAQAAERQSTPSRAAVRDPVLKSGEDTARRMCSACHVVAADQEIPPLLRPPAASFEEIANRPNTSVATVREFVLGAHYDMKTLPAGMPNLMLTKDEATAVARYLLTLRKR